MQIPNGGQRSDEDGLNRGACLDLAGPVAHPAFSPTLVDARDRDIGLRSAVVEHVPCMRTAARCSMADTCIGVARYIDNLNRRSTTLIFMNIHTLYLQPAQSPKRHAVQSYTDLC